ncbi:MAG: ATP synthase F1 subunit epsilon [Patescibacteria group bacterium]
MASKLKFEIITPERVVLKDEVDQITLPTAEGEITVLPNHIPLIGVLRPGEIVAKKDREEIAMSCSGGFIEVTGDKVLILADTAEKAEELVEAEILKAKERAQKIIEEKQVDAERYANAAASLERELARLKVVRKRSRGRAAPSIKVEE